MQSYLQKNAVSNALVKEGPSSDIIASIVIPSFNEPLLFSTIQSVLDAHIPPGRVEILVILNHPISADQSVAEFHQSQYDQICQWSVRNLQDKFYLACIPPVVLPNKIAGVGMARKLGMDEAVRRFELLNRDGIIINLDADCLVSKSYLNELIDFHHTQADIDAISIGFEHNLDIEDREIREAIILYEIHLRTYIGWQKQFAYPFAFQTLGSCFSVRSKAYQALGGMNKRKAGEDFYFLHKYSVLSKLATLNKALVYPSGRISHRVPFGTGKAVADIIQKKKKLKTYNPEAIQAFCNFMKEISTAYSDFQGEVEFSWFSPVVSLNEFLHASKFGESLKEAKANSAGESSYQKRISRWFDPFRLMKYLHFARQHEYPDIDVQDSAQKLLRSCGMFCDQNANMEELLQALRQKDYPERIL